MNIVIKMLKGIGFGLFRIHLWLPVLYSVIFLIAVIAGGLTGVGAWFAFGLVASLIGSAALTYYGFYRKEKKGDYRSGEKTVKTREKRKLLIPGEPAEDIIPRRAAAGQPVYPYYVPPQPQPPVYDQQIMQQQAAQAAQDSYRQQMPAYEASRTLYGNSYGQTAPRMAPPEQLGYDPRSALYESGYGSGSGRNHEQGYDPAAQLYGNAPAVQPRMTADAARGSLYEPEPAGPAYATRDDAAQTLYPGQSAARESLGRGDASQALYPAKEQASFGGYDRASAGGALYHQTQQSDYKTFSPYMQPVNSILPNSNRSLYDAPQVPVAQEPMYDREADIRRRDAEFMSAANIPPAPVNTRRREAPIQIFATKSDENTYVYEYADRFEFIKLLEDGNKELIKTDFKK